MQYFALSMVIWVQYSSQYDNTIFFLKFKYIYETSKNYTVWALTCVLISVTPDHSLTPLVTWLAFVAPKQRLWHRKKGGKEAGRQPHIKQWGGPRPC